MRFIRHFRGGIPNSAIITSNVGTTTLFDTQWPNNFIIPFSAKRKAAGYDQNVNRAAQSSVNGTFHNLYARIDRVASPGTKAHDFYRAAVEDILGVFIGTQSATNGKQAGYYYDEDTFIPLDQMGDGVSEIVALIVDLSLAKGKVFVLEEPETNLHPKGLKALLNLVRESSKYNQFIIATHSNVVVRELGSSDKSKIFRVYRDSDAPNSPSSVHEIANSPAAHLEVLRDLGYEFSDLNLHDGWLFLEESSAETIIRDVLIPWFAPELRGRIRTFSAAGVQNLEPTISEFQRLVTFVHLDPVYRERLWVRADGDEPGREIIAKLQSKFPYLASPKAEIFSKPQFELFYPEAFQERANRAISIKDKKIRIDAKANLLKDVLRWSIDNPEEAKAAWQMSAAEQIDLLSSIKTALSL